MTRRCVELFLTVPLLWATTLVAASAVTDEGHHQDVKHDSPAQESQSPRILQDQRQTSRGVVTVEGVRITYQAEIGLQVVYTKDPIDDDPPVAHDEHTDPPPPPPHAAMSYVAYFKGDQEDPQRPITFLFNGGPGSSTIWLHMGAFGPRRVRTSDAAHGPAAPYPIVENEYSLLDVSDLVFIDAPGTGYGHLRGPDKEKAFWGVDQDAHAFANFIVEFVSRHGRWNSPKYVFGESYGTARAAVLTNVLQDEKSLDLNGLILLSQILSYDNTADDPQFNPGVDQPYVLVLPTYAATAWYHHKLAHQAQALELEPFLTEVEQFALHEYWPALMEGNTLSPERRSAIAARLHDYTGLPEEYIEQADLRINVGEFNKTVLGADMTAARLDTRFAGPTIDPMSKEADYDPQQAALCAAYVSAFNEYAHRTLGFVTDTAYKRMIDNYGVWDFRHQPPGSDEKLSKATNVAPDLAHAMKTNPRLKVMMNGGYYDLATPFFTATYELRHLAIPPSVRDNIETHFYPAGHMVYARELDLKALHDNVAAFIRKTHQASGR